MKYLIGAIIILLISAIIYYQYWSKGSIRRYIESMTPRGGGRGRGGRGGRGGGRGRGGRGGRGGGRGRGGRGRGAFSGHRGMFSGPRGGRGHHRGRGGKKHFRKHPKQGWKGYGGYGYGLPYLYGYLDPGYYDDYYDDYYDPQNFTIYRDKKPQFFKKGKFSRRTEDIQDALDSCYDSNCSMVAHNTNTGSVYYFKPGSPMTMENSSGWDSYIKI